MEITFTNELTGKTYTMDQTPQEDGSTLLSIGEEVKEEFKKPEEILNGVDLNQDSLFLMGYIWAEGNQNRVFPTEHFCDLHNFIIKKYGNAKPVTP